MRRFVIACVLLCASSAHAAPVTKSDVFKSIDLAYAAGQLSLADRIFYKVAAVRAPHLLPERFRKIIREGVPSAACTAPVMHEGFKSLRELPEPERGRLRSLLLPPVDLAYTLDATTPFPIRVSYDDPALHTKAQLLMDSAVTSYNKQVTEWGFWEPPIEPGAEFYRYFLTDSGMGGGGYTSPYSENADTPHTDAFSYIVIDRDNPNDAIPITVAHEFNHACQVGMDAYEVTGFLENTATWIESQVFPDDWIYTVAAFSYFQAQPYRPLEYMNMGNSDLYEYGGALWVHFLEHIYGNMDPAWIRQVWEGSVQYSWDNEPDYFDVIEDMLAADGGMAEAVKLFAHYRYFVGTDDDGQHFPMAHSWWDTEVEKLAVWRTADLPLLDKEPGTTAVQPQPNGCNYIELTIPTTVGDRPIRFSFAGDGALTWNVDVIRVADGQDTVFDRMELSDDATGQVVVDSALGLDRIVMAVCQIAPQGYDPDFRAWTAGHYTYSIEYALPPPVITSVTPDRIATGSHDVLLTVRGSGFQDHETLTVGISGEGVRVDLERFVSTEELLVRVFVSPDAALGPRDITVTNPGGTRGVGENLVTIVSPDELVDAGPDGGSTGDPKPGGCGCRNSSSRSGGVPWIFALLMVLAAIFRYPTRTHRKRK